MNMHSFSAARESISHMETTEAKLSTSLGRLSSGLKLKIDEERAGSPSRPNWIRPSPVPRPLPRISKTDSRSSSLKMQRKVAWGQSLPVCPNSVTDTTTLPLT